jgi:hypothetical protein
MLSSLTSAKAALAAAVGAGVLLTGGVGAATAGVLPGAAQDTASDMLAKVGVTVPGADERSAGNAEERDASDDATTTEPELPDAAGHGQEVADTAKTTTSTGAEKGEEISGVASQGRSEDGRAHAEEHGDVESGKPAESDEAGDADEAGTTGKDTAAAHTDATEDAGDTADEEHADVEDADDDADDSADKADDLSDDHSTAGTTKRP